MKNIACYSVKLREITFLHRWNSLKSGNKLFNTNETITVTICITCLNTKMTMQKYVLRENTIVTILWRLYIINWIQVDYEWNMPVSKGIKV